MSGNTPQSIFEKLWNSHHILTDEGESLMYVDVALAQENTLHAFTNPQANDPANGFAYSESATQRSMKMLADFLGEIF